MSRMVNGRNVEYGCDDLQVMAMAAIGRPGTIEQLSEMLRAREKPNDRRPVRSFAFEGKYRVE